MLFNVSKVRVGFAALTCSCAAQEAVALRFQKCAENSQDKSALTKKEFDLGVRDNGVTAQSGRADASGCTALPLDVMPSVLRFLTGSDANNLRKCNKAHHDLVQHRDVVKARVREDWNAIQQADDELKSDEKFMMEVVKINPRCMLHASDDLKKDKKFVLWAMKFALARDDKFPVDVLGMCASDTRFTMKNASDELKNDPSFVLDALRLADEFKWRDVSKYFEEPSVKLFVKTAAKQYFMATIMQHAGDELKNNRGFLEEVERVAEYNDFLEVYNYWRA